MKRFRVWRANTAANRARTMTTKELSARYWDLRTRRRWDHVFMATMLVGGLAFFAASADRDNTIDAQQAQLEEQHAQLETALDEIVAVRSTARERECQRDNAQLMKALGRERQSWLDFIRHSTGGVPLPPDQQAKVEPFLADQEKAVRDEFSDRAPRPCDPASIDAYYETQR